MKIKYTLLLLIFLSNISKKSIAQAERKIEIYSGYDFNNYGNSSLRRSMKSFETYWNQHGEPNLNVKGFKTASDFNYGVNILSKRRNSDSYRIWGIQHFKLNSTSKAEYLYGTRCFHILTKGMNFFVGVRNDKGLSYKLGLGLNNSVLESYYKYPSGVISFGKDKDLNGVYGTTNGCSLSLEITKQKTFFKHIGLEAGIILTTSGFSTHYYDFNYAKSMNTNVNYEWIPQDFNAFYKAVNSSEVYEGKNVKSNNNSIGLILRASYMFNIKKR
jgi:hypothetical protein